MQLHHGGFEIYRGYSVGGINLLSVVEYDTVTLNQNIKYVHALDRVERTRGEKSGREVTYFVFHKRRRRIH